MAITPLPAAPSRSSPSDFSTKADAFIAALATFVTETNAVAAAMDLNDTTAASTSSVAIGTGAKSFTVDSSKSYQVGMSVKIAFDSTNWMFGEVTSYNPTTGALVVNVTLVSGSGTKTSWTVTLSGPMALAGLTATVAELNSLAGSVVQAAELNALLRNIGIVATVSSKALTVALKGANGNDPSATNPVRIPFRDETVATGTPNIRSVTAALSVVLSSGSTLGFGANEAGRIYIWAIDNAGTVALGLSRTADIFPESALASTTAEGGAGAADSAAVMYSTAALSSKAVHCLGYIEIVTGATAGEWDNAATKVQVMGPGVHRTGDIIRIVSSSTGTPGSTSVAIPYDDTIPQKTEGEEVLTVTPSQTSPLNKLCIEGHMPFVFASGVANIMAFFVDDEANAIAACAILQQSIYHNQLHLYHEMTAGAVGTIKMRYGANSGTAYWLQIGGPANIFGGIAKLQLKVTEIFA